MNTTVLENPVFGTWKTVKLGTGLKTADDFRGAAELQGMKIVGFANDIIEKPTFSVSTNETEVELVNVSVAELGFTDGATCEDFYARAKELGLGLCPPEVGPQLRLQYLDQPEYKWIAIAMDPITDSDGILRVFDMRLYEGVPLLNAVFGFPCNILGPRSRYIFLRFSTITHK